jgi:tetratricopeptide (TPR) repeat protein
MPAQPEHVTVVFAGISHPWAAWITEQLEGVSLRTRTVRWDPLRRAPGAAAIVDLLDRPGHILLVLDDWYLRFDSGRTSEWGEILKEVVPRYRDRIAAVSVTARELPEAAAALEPVKLEGYLPEEARRRLLACVGAEGAPWAEGLTSVRRYPPLLPGIWNLSRRNRRFTGREKVFEQLHDRFNPGNQPVGAVVALHGPAGVGKTQVALEYAHRYAGEYDIVWWVSSAVRATARAQFADLAAQLDVAYDEQPRSIAAAGLKLRRTELRWLVVFDGADDPEDLAPLIPAGPGHVLVTTTRGAAWKGQGAEPLELTAFERKESVAFACRRADRLSEASADQLAHVLQDWPLLLDQTAAWIDTNPAASVDDYLAEIRNGNPHGFDVEGSQGYPPFRTAWAATLNTLYERAPEAGELLRLFAYFSPDAIPLRLLQTARSGDLPSHLAELVAEPSSWNSALRTLSEATSMRLEYGQGPRMDVLTVDSLRIHRLFHRFVRSDLSPAADKEMSAIACRVLVAADPRDPTSPANWSRYAELIPHLEPAGALDSAEKDVRTLVLDCIEYLRMRGEYDEGQRLAEQAVQRWRAVSGGTDRLVLVAVHQQANMLRRLGRYGEAEAVGRAVLDEIAGTPDIHGIELLRAKDGLAGTLMALGRYQEARDLFAEAAADAAELGEARYVPRTLAVRSNLGVAVGLLGRYGEAHAIHRSVLQAREGLLGPRHHLTLNAALNTAWALRLLGRYEEAMAIQEGNCALHSQVLDRNHFQTLLAQHNLALCLRRNGRMLEARTLMRKLHERLARRRGPDHPETLMVAADLAMALRQEGDHAEALRLAEKTALRYEQQVGERHPYAVGSRGNVALVLRSRGDHHEALRIAELSWKSMTEAVGPAHPWTVGCALNTLGALHRVGDDERAAQVGREAVARARDAVGERHPLTYNCTVGLAQSLRPTGRADEADELERMTFEAMGDTLGDHHTHTESLRAGVLPYWDFEPQPI